MTSQRSSTGAPPRQLRPSAATPPWGNGVPPAEGPGELAGTPNGYGETSRPGAPYGTPPAGYGTGAYGPAPTASPYGPPSGAIPYGAPASGYTGAQPYATPATGAQPYVAPGTAVQPYVTSGNAVQPYVGPGTGAQPYAGPGTGAQPYPPQGYPTPPTGAQPYPQGYAGPATGPQAYVGPGTGVQPYPQGYAGPPTGVPSYPAPMTAPTGVVLRAQPEPPVPAPQRDAEDAGRPERGGTASGSPGRTASGRLARRAPRPPRGGQVEDLRGHRMRVQGLKLLWTATFFALVFIPLALAPEAGGERRPWSKGGIWVELCLTTGLLGLSTLAATLVLPSRVKSLTQAFGIEGVLRSHRWLAVATTVTVIAHVVFIVIDKPLNVLLLSPGPTGANRARAGLVATVAMVLLCWLSFRRRKMGTRYDVWRWVHAMLAVAALVGTYMHVFWLNHLMQNAAERTVFLVILVTVSAVMINRWVRRPFSSLRNAYVVKAVHRETPTVSTLVLSPARRRQRPMAYRPGQFAWIRLDSPFGPLQGNPFSLASGIDSPREIEFTIRNAGDFTQNVGQLTIGRKVFVDGPYGDFNADSRGADSLLLIGAGVGMSPMMSILRSHAFRGDRRPHCLLQAQRTSEELMFQDELADMQRDMDLEVIEVLSKPPAVWDGATGRVDEELLGEVLEEYDLYDAHVFICGPPAMMDAAKEALVSLGIPAGRVHTEAFDMV